MAKILSAWNNTDVDGTTRTAVGNTISHPCFKQTTFTLSIKWKSRWLSLVPFSNKGTVSTGFPGCARNMCRGMGGAVIGVLLYGCYVTGSVPVLCSGFALLPRYRISIEISIFWKKWTFLGVCWCFHFLFLGDISWCTSNVLNMQNRMIYERFMKNLQHQLYTGKSAVGPITAWAVYEGYSFFTSLHITWAGVFQECHSTRVFSATRMCDDVSFFLRGI